MTGDRRFTGSLLARIVVGYVLIAAVFGVAWLLSLYGPLTQAALNQQQRNLTAVAQAAALVTQQSSATPDAIARTLVAQTDLRLTIVESDGAVLADSDFDPLTMENHSDRQEIAAALAGTTGVSRRLSQTEGTEQLYVAVPALFQGRRVALRVSQPIARIQEIASRSRRLGLLLLAGALVVGLAIAVSTTREATRPIRELSSAAQRMAEGDLAVDIPAVPSDLETLAQALTTLRGQVKTRLEALEAEQVTLRTTLDGLADAVLLLDGDTIRFANASASHLLRTPLGGWQDAPLVRAALPAGVRAIVMDGRKRHEPGVWDLAPDPTGRVLRVTIVPLAQDTPLGRTIVTVADITELARLDRVRRDFVANASHELKTPAAGIRLLAQSVEMAAGDGDVEQSLAFARQIESEAERLQHLVADLLDLSRLESAPAPGALTDIRQAVGNVVISHRSPAERKGIGLAADFSAVETQDLYVAADPTDVAVALDNLVDNAIAYSADGSVTVRVHATDDLLSLSVSDTGPGIAPEHHPRIFERFYRIDRGRSRSEGGTGLGLALVRHAAERSGGSVRLESTAEHGSTFTVTFRRAR